MITSKRFLMLMLVWSSMSSAKEYDFEKLNLEKVMYFNNHQPISYKQSLVNLSEQLGVEYDLKVIEDTLKTALFNEAKALSQKIDNPVSHNILVNFHRWAISIHNKNLIPPENQRFPNNIVYDLITAARNNKEASTKENRLMRFFLEGLNARKISNGESPSVDFISTSLMLDTISSLKDSFTLSSKEDFFLEKYSRIKLFEESQSEMEQEIAKLKKNKIFAYLSQENNNIFDFQRIRNPISQAHAYYLVAALDTGVKRLNEYPQNLEKHMEKMVAEIENLFKDVLPKFMKVLEDPQTQPIRGFGIWDASEWISRAIVALQLSEALNPDKFKNRVEDIMKNPFISELYFRCLSGNFPAKERNDDIAGVEIVELFLQNMISSKK